MYLDSRFTVAYRAFLALITLSSMGCDPVRTTRQAVELRIVDKITREPARAVTVRVKEAFIPPARDDEAIRWARENWENFSWHEGTTDSAGKVIVDIVYTVIDGNRSRVVPAQRSVAGIEFLARTVNKDGVTEEASFMMNRGYAFETDSYLFEVVTLRGPEYVD